MPVVESMPPEPVAGRPPGGVTAAVTVTTNDVLNPLIEPEAVPVYVPGVVGMEIVADATPTALQLTCTVVPAIEMSTTSPGVQLVTVMVTVPPGTTVGGLTVTIPGSPPY